MCRGDVEELFGVAAGIDQGADVDVPRGDDAVERRLDPPERVQLLEPLDVRARRFHRRLLGLQVAVGVVEILPRHRIASNQVAISLGRGVRQPCIRLGGGEISMAILLRGLMVGLDGGKSVSGSVAGKKPSLGTQFGMPGRKAYHRTARPPWTSP